MKRVTFVLVVRISAMQIIGSFKIVTDVTSVVPTFFAALRFFDLLVLLGFTVAFAFAVRLRRGVSLLRERFSGAARPPKNPLASWAQLDQLMCALLLLCRAAGAAAFFGFALFRARLNKKIQKNCRNIYCGSSTIYSLINRIFFCFS